MSEDASIVDCLLSSLWSASLNSNVNLNRMHTYLCFSLIDQLGSDQLATESSVELHVPGNWMDLVTPANYLYHTGKQLD